MTILPISKQSTINEMSKLLKEHFKKGKSLYAFGNGGLASGCDHFVAELNKSFIENRNIKRALDNHYAWYDSLEYGYSAYSLCNNSALITAISNDISYDNVFAQQLYVFANNQDVAIGATTSGKSENIIRGLQVANGLGMITILICSKLPTTNEDIDYILETKSDVTADVQEEILTFIHKLCKEFE